MQEKLEKGKFVFCTENGENEEFETLLTFKNKKNNMNYVIYTDNTYDQEGNISLFASKYLNDSEELSPVETEAEWQLIEKVLLRETLTISE
ncbi:MAG: DUF1292 domain-containing protein [Bacilli bacterium]|nr:DUF1292 domain-containing protein [Bacilli bacterium]